MSQTRYCSTCGTLLAEGAAICGECGARYQASPYERRATDAPGAWSQAPRQRSRELSEDQAPPEEDGVELITRDSLEPKNPSATTLRSQEQYDQLMVTQPPMNQNAPGPGPSMPSGPGSPGPAPSAPPTAQEMERPLDGCSPAAPLKRFLAALVDAVIGSLVMVPLLIGLILVLTSEEIGLLPQILIGVGTALPAAYTVLIIWLSGAKGFSLGKLILGLRITRVSAGGPLGFLRALGRWVLYGLVPLIMALSIFIDPKKQLRGFHDRVVDSVVVDIKAGRNPMQPRPDDFERESAEHYLGAPSVAVSTHENLLAKPGAAWEGSSAPEASQPAAGGWADPQQGAPSPYAPPVSGSSASTGSAADAPGAAAPWGSVPGQDSAAPQQPAGGGWAPPPVDPVPSQQSSWDQPAPAPQQSWGQSDAEQQQPGGQPGADAQPQQSWGQPGAEQQSGWGQPDPAQQTWGQPSAEPQPPSWDASAPQQYGGPEQQGGQAPSWEQPIDQPPAASPQQPWQQQSAPEAPRTDDVQGWGPPPSEQPSAPSAPYGQAPEAPAPAAHDGAGAGTAGVPSDLTGDAWGADESGVDEQTRLTVADDSLGDLEQTRISAVKLPPVKKLRLVTDDGAERTVEKAVVLGRNPSAPGEEVLFVMKDDTRSVSKTHLRIDGTGDDVTVTDLGSTNGSTILREDGSRENLVPNSPTVLPTGAQVTLGDRTVSVEREQ